MSFGDTIGYLVFGNPVSQAIINTTYDLAKSTNLLVPKKMPTSSAASVPLPPPAPPVQLSLSEIAGSSYNMLRLAGLSGATAVIMGAYGKHVLTTIPDIKDQLEAKAIFETANRFHFLHSIALLAMPLAHRPALTGSLMATGTILFSGTMYYRALTGDKTFVHVATCGGFCLIAAWLTLIF